MDLENVCLFLLSSLLSACFLLAVGFAAALLSGCDGNHIIGEAPDPCFVSAECVDTVVDDFCVECDEDLAFRRGFVEGSAHGYREGFTAAQEQDTHECPDVDVVEPDACEDDGEDDGEDTCDLTVPVGHRPIECRGKGHTK